MLKTGNMELRSPRTTGATQSHVRNRAQVRLDRAAGFAPTGVIGLVPHGMLMQGARSAFASLGP